MACASHKKIPVFIGLLTLLASGCGKTGMLNSSSTTSANEHNAASAVSKQDIDFALAKAEKVSNKLEDLLFVLGEGQALNLSLRFVCKKDEACNIPNKLFGKDLEMLPDNEREFVGGVVTDLLGTPIEEIPNFKSFRLLNRKEKVVVILKFTKRKFPLQVTVENPEGGTVQVDKADPCGGVTCPSFQIPFDDYANLTAIPLPDWEVETWSILDAVKAAEAVPELRSISIRQTKNGLKVRIKFRRKPPITYFTNTEIAAMERGPALIAPNQIDLCTAQDLEKIRANPAGNFRLMCDIDLAARPWNVLPYFSGSLDGMNHKISNLKITAGAPRPKISAFAYDSNTFSLQYGFFGTITSGARIANLTLTDAVVEAPSSGSSTINSHVGILAGWLIGARIEISYVNISGKVTARNVANIGGVAGYVTESNFPQMPNPSLLYSAKLSHVRARAIIDGGRDLSVNMGGLVGQSFVAPMTIEFSEFIGTVGSVSDVPESNLTAGGLAGSYSGTIQRSKFSGIVAGARNVGGLVGMVPNRSSVTILESRTSGEVHSQIQTSSSGGLVGDALGLSMVGLGSPLRIERSYSDADVGLWISPGQAVLIKATRAKSGLPTSSQNTGGLVGEFLATNAPIIRDSYYAGRLHGGSTSGGIVGRASFQEDISCASPATPLLQNVYFNGRTVFAMDSIDPLSLQDKMSQGIDSRKIVIRSAIASIDKGFTYHSLKRCPEAYFQRHFINAYWNNGLTDVEDDFAVGLDPSQMNDKGRFLGFDFTNVWTMDARTDSPQLRWQQQ